MTALLEDPSLNTFVTAQIDLDARIAAAFANDAKSNDVAALIKDSEHAAASASDLAEQARNHALDPVLSGAELKDARECMDDAAFKRDRLQAALGKLRERRAELKDQEENARRQVAYDKAKAVRDDLAREWPTSIQLLPKSSPNCYRASPPMTARSSTSMAMPCHQERSVCSLPNWLLGGSKASCTTRW